MKRYIKWFVAIILLGSITIQADPFETWNWTDPTQYENNQPIPSGDIINTTLYCSNNSGPPYEANQIFDMQTPPSIEDMAFIVAGVPGTYYCVATVSSLQYNTTSRFSNEKTFIVASGDLGFVPKPPVLQ